jgi:hypothetical protein
MRQKMSEHVVTITLPETVDEQIRQAADRGHSAFSLTSICMARVALREVNTNNTYLLKIVTVP